MPRCDTVLSHRRWPPKPVQEALPQPTAKVARDHMVGKIRRLVGPTGFGPAASCSQSTRSAKLSYGPTSSF